MERLEQINHNRAVLAGLVSPALNRFENADEKSMDELSALLETAGGTCVGSVLQHRDKPEAARLSGRKSRGNPCVCESAAGGYGDI
jgi:GTP-binding protein HflX